MRALSQGTAEKSVGACVLLVKKLSADKIIMNGLRIAKSVKGYRL